MPHLLFQNLYESIKNEPFKIPEDDGNDLTHTFFNPDREGWLLKLGERPTSTPCVALTLMFYSLTVVAVRSLKPPVKVSCRVCSLRLCATLNLPSCL